MFYSTKLLSKFKYHNCLSDPLIRLSNYKGLDYKGLDCCNVFRYFWSKRYNLAFSIVKVM